MKLTSWVCPHCRGKLDLTTVDISSEFVCEHCDARVEIEDEGEDPTELAERKARRNSGRARIVLFVATAFSGLMGMVLVGQANEYLSPDVQLGKLPHSALCSVIGAGVAALVLKLFSENTQRIRAATFLAFGMVAATNLALVLHKGMHEDAPLLTQLWAVSGFWIISGSLMLMFGSRRPPELNVAPKAENS
ncbi:hypothetical protein OAU50_02550 [Planctomycetota bacterium]|nr:hypothetical protein [Planctomycetota bacterium]